MVLSEQDGMPGWLRVILMLVLKIIIAAILIKMIAHSATLQRDDAATALFPYAVIPYF